MKQRLFTFGCSFTSYRWPTWADILGREFDYFENWGVEGAGNQLIMNSLVECHLKNQLNENDTVCVMWTNVTREDRYVNRDWIRPGNIFSQKVYDSNFVKKFADVRGYYIRDLATIFLADKFLESLKCRKIFFSMVDIINPTDMIYPGPYSADKANAEILDLLDAYSPVLDKVRPSVHRVVFDLDWKNQPATLFLRKSDALEYWRSWYHSIRAESWPDCDHPQDFDSLPDLIKVECKQNFDHDRVLKEFYRLDKIYQDKKKSIKDNAGKPAKEINTHPMPFQHLEYLNKICPDIPISPATRDWINKINSLGLQGECYSHLYLDKKTLSSKPKRW